MTDHTRISVIGSGASGANVLDDAETVGALIARREGLVVCGGLGGVMEAACRGAKREGGTTIGILPSGHAGDANDFVDIPIPTGMGEARNVIVALTGDGVVAVGGRFGTLSEISFALKADKPVAAVRSLDVDQIVDAPNFFRAGSPDDAVGGLFERI